MGQLTGLSGIIKRGMATAQDEGELQVSGEAQPRSERAAGPRLARGREKAVGIRAKAVTKSKDPAWKAYSLFLKKETHSEMNFILRRLDAGEDMSDLVQRLVEGWVTANR